MREEDQSRMPNNVYVATGTGRGTPTLYILHKVSIQIHRSSQ